MRKTKILTNKNKFLLRVKLLDYLREIVADDENFSTLEDLYQDAKRVKVYGRIRYLTPALITEWLQGLPIGTEFVTYNIFVMVLSLLGLDASYAEKLGDTDSIYVENQTDIDSFYWNTLGEIIYQEHYKEI